MGSYLDHQSAPDPQDHPDYRARGALVCFIFPWFWLTAETISYSTAGFGWGDIFFTFLLSVTASAVAWFPFGKRKSPLHLLWASGTFMMLYAIFSSFGAGYTPNGALPVLAQVGLILSMSMLVAGGVSISLVYKRFPFMKPVGRAFSQVKQGIEYGHMP